MKLRLHVICLCGILATSVAGAEDFRLEVSKDSCDRIVKYVADPDVTYKPGVDVHGNAVPPADIDANSIVLPDNIYVDLSLPIKDLLKNYNPKLKNADVYVGAIVFDIQSGRLLYNGQELSDPAQNAIAVECRKRYQ
ncbi:hypothetical protein [Sneathiella sp.]|uniref:hypothetical protein n=1 Tax=Sneathiella sp. TaxID=1964365 RepID=UPI003562F1DB